MLVLTSGAGVIVAVISNDTVRPLMLDPILNILAVEKGENKKHSGDPFHGQGVVIAGLSRAGAGATSRRACTQVPGKPTCGHQRWEVDKGIHERVERCHANDQGKGKR